MGWVEKWNNFAKKKVYINETLEIGCGRLVFSAIIFAVQVLWGLMAGATAVEIMPSLLTWVMSFKQHKNVDT